MDQLSYYTSFKSLKDAIQSQRNAVERVGFVPTMGALHQGHISLMEEAHKDHAILVVSIFVNPTQFNNPIDLEKYPRTLDEDVLLIKNRFPNALIISPDFEEVYGEDIHFPGIDLNGLDQIMEGEFRPGHFQGVCHVVYNLFQLIQPDAAYFGEKDFQQVAIIKYMVEQLHLPVHVKVCPTKRNEQGLALSSRNLRLSDQQKEDALVIYRSLRWMQSEIHHLSIQELKEKVVQDFASSSLTLEYLVFVDPHNLAVIETYSGQSVTCCIAAYCGEVRLIDNLSLC